MADYFLPEQTYTAVIGGGSATEAKQDAQIVIETAIRDRLPATLGQKASAASLAAVLSTEQENILTGMSGKLPATLGQKASAASLSTVLSTEQQAILTAISTGTTKLGVIDQIDTTPLLDVSLSNIPASANPPLQIVASLAANCRKILSIDDIGEYIGLYIGGVGAEVLYCIMPLGGGEMEVNIPAASRISLRNMKNSAIVSDFIAINFLG